MILSETGGKYDDKVHVVHCGVDLRKYSSKAEPSNSSQLDIFCTGTLHEVKGQHLIEAVSILKQRGLDVILNLIGDGPDRNALQNHAVDHCVSDSVVFHGNCDRNEVVGLLQSAHIVAATSVPTSDGRREGIPVALMEAMATGIPVVASRLSGIPELVQHRENGLLVEPGDSQQIADALEALAVAPELQRQYGNSGRAKVKNEFDLRAEASKLVNLIHKSRSSFLRSDDESTLENHNSAVVEKRELVSC